jgi:hypothetical protein
MNEGDNSLPPTIIDRRDIQTTFDQVVGSIKYLLDEIEGLRKKYQLNQLVRPEKRLDPKVNTLRSSKSLVILSSLRSPLTLRQRVLENQKQKSFLILTKWAICDARKFHDKVGKLKCLVDGLEDITRASGLANPNPVTASSIVPDDNPPPYSATESQEPPSTRIERIHQPPNPETTVPTNSTPPNSSLSPLSQYYYTLKRFLSGWPDESVTPGSKVRSRLLALTALQFQELVQDVHDELLRRQRYNLQTSQWLPHNPTLHPRRNEARRRLSTIVHFRQLVSDIVVEFERRLKSFEIFQYSNISPPVPNLLTPVITPNISNQRRWGVYEAPPLLQYRAAHHTICIDPTSVATNRASIPISSFYNPSMNPNQNLEPHQDPEANNSDIWQCSEGRQWPMDRVLSWLVIHDFSIEWQSTFKSLNICGGVFLTLGDSNGGRGTFGTMHKHIYPRLATECVRSGKDWHQSIQREEGKRLRHLVRRIPFRKAELETPNRSNPITTRSDASVEFF